MINNFLGYCYPYNLFWADKASKKANFNGFGNLQVKANWHEISNNGKKIIYKKTDEGQWVVQPVTTNGNEWYSE